MSPLLIFFFLSSISFCSTVYLQKKHKPQHKRAENRCVPEVKVSPSPLQNLQQLLEANLPNLSFQ